MKFKIATSAQLWYLQPCGLIIDYRVKQQTWILKWSLRRTSSSPYPNTSSTNHYTPRRSLRPRPRSGTSSWGCIRVLWRTSPSCLRAEGFRSSVKNFVVDRFGQVALRDALWLTTFVTHWWRTVHHRLFLGIWEIFKCEQRVFDDFLGNYCHRSDGACRFKISQS